MHALIIAGGRPNENDPLHEFSQGQQKCLIEVAGKPMASWVFSALQASPHVEGIVVVGLPSGSLDDAGSALAYLPEQEGLIPNIVAGMKWIGEHFPGDTHLILATGDTPLLTTTTVDAFIAACQPVTGLLYYPFVERHTMEQQFPGAARTYTRLKHFEGAGGDLFIAKISLIKSNLKLWEELTNARKHPWKVAKVVGMGMLLKLLFRQLSLSDIETRAKAILGGPIKLVAFPEATIAMDVDKPHQLQMVRKRLRQMRPDH